MLDAPADGRGAPGILLTGLDLLPIGIGVFAPDYRLVYCNAAFCQLRSLPEPLCRPGTALEQIVGYIANRGDYGPGEVKPQVERRLAEIAGMRLGEVEQDIPGGRRLSIRHTPVPGGGLMITYADVSEARETERKLRANEERYALVSQAVAEGIYDWNVDDNSLFMSPRLMEIFGFEGSGLSSQDWFRLVHEADREGYREALRSCFRGESRRLDCEYRILVRSGEYHWVEDHGLPVRDAAGRAVRLVGAVSDVTARKETERALRESEQRHELALEAINESVYEWDIVTGAIYYSPRLYAIVGLTPDELRTVDDWLQRIHPDDLASYREATRAHLKGSTGRLEVEYRYRHSDGTWHWARQHGLALRDESGRAVRVTGSTGDVTAEKRMAEELERARGQLHEAIETMAEGFVLFDPQDRMVMCNTRYRELFHAVADEVRPGNTFESILRAAVARGMFSAAGTDPDGWVAALLNRRRTIAGPRETQLSSGVHLQVSDFAMRDGSRVAVYTDVSDIRRGQDELMRAKAQAEAALEKLQAAQQQLIVQEKLASLGQLTAGIAHEIKNPLNFVNNFADLSTELVDELTVALRGTLDRAGRDEVDALAAMIRTNLTKIVEHGRRADSIVKNMLLHSREGASERRSIDVNATADESLNLAYHGARAESAGFNITLESDLDPDAGSIDAYPQEFVRVLLNLISNGFYAAQQRKRANSQPGFEPVLRLSTKGFPEHVEIRVRDNGVGIPDNVRSRMFDPFFTTKPAGEGTGLGLSLSYDVVVKQHGGRIDVQTEPGEFTEFVVTLPRRAG